MAPRVGNLQGIRNLPTMLGGIPLMRGSRGFERQWEGMNQLGMAGARNPGSPVNILPSSWNPPSPGYSSGPGGVPNGPGGGPSTGGGLTVQPYPGAPGGGTNPALEMFNNLYKQNTEGSIQNFNRAANRLRERVDSMGAGAAQQMTGNALSRGFIGGNLQGNLQDLEAQKMGAYGQGLVGLESEFEKNRLQGLDQALGAAQGISGDFQGGADRALKQWLGQLQSNTDLTISREGNKNNIDLNRINNNSRSLQDLLDNLTGIIGQGGSY